MKAFDLDALVLEETTEPFTFTFGGEEFSVPAHYDPRIFRRADEGDIAGALRLMIGDEQWARLDKIDKPFDERHMRALFTAWTSHEVTTVGEASASSSSSRGTGRQSKQTSNGSMGSSSEPSSSDES